MVNPNRLLSNDGWDPDVNRTVMATAQAMSNYRPNDVSIHNEVYIYICASDQITEEIYCVIRGIGYMDSPTTRQQV